MLTTDNSRTQEIVPAHWPFPLNDTLPMDDDSNWDILNEDGSQDVLNRHWFKQNYINPQSDTNKINYH